MNNCTLSLKKRSKLQSMRTFPIRIFPSEPPCSRKTEKSSPERISKTDLSGLRTAPSEARFLPPLLKACALLSRSRLRRPLPIIRSAPARRIRSRLEELRQNDARRTVSLRQFTRTCVERWRSLKPAVSAPTDCKIIPFL